MRSIEVAEGEPGRGTHVPFKGCTQVGGLEVLRDKGRILISGAPRLDRTRESAMELGAVGLKLRFIGDGSDQRMPERILDGMTECHLVDNFSRDQRGHVRVVNEVNQQVCVEPQADDRRGIKSLLGGGGKRSMRAPIVD